MNTAVKNDNIRIPLYFVMAFLVVFIVNGIFVYMAVTTNHGVVTENAYEKGLRYDEVVAEIRTLNAKSMDGSDAP
jgi:nitrogen fixation protein FixH